MLIGPAGGLWSSHFCSLWSFVFAGAKNLHAFLTMQASSAFFLPAVYSFSWNFRICRLNLGWCHSFSYLSVNQGPVSIFFVVVDSTVHWRWIGAWLWPLGIQVWKVCDFKCKWDNYKWFKNWDKTEVNQQFMPSCIQGFLCMVTALNSSEICRDFVPFSSSGKSFRREPVTLHQGHSQPLFMWAVERPSWGFQAGACW